MTIPITDADIADARRWRALMACQRVRRTGWTLDGNHIGLELWVRHPAKHPSADYPQDDCRAGLEKFADDIILTQIKDETHD